MTPPSVVPDQQNVRPEPLFPEQWLEGIEAWHFEREEYLDAQAARDAISAYNALRQDFAHEVRMLQAENAQLKRDLQVAVDAAKASHAAR